MNTLKLIIIGVVLGLVVLYLTAKPYTTSDESNIRLYENVVAK